MLHLIFSLAFDIWQWLTQMPGSPIVSFSCKPASSHHSLPANQLPLVLKEWTRAGLVAIQSGGQGPTALIQLRVIPGCFPEASGKYPPLSHCTGSAAGGGPGVGGGCSGRLSTGSVCDCDSCRGVAGLRAWEGGCQGGRAAGETNQTR